MRAGECELEHIRAGVSCAVLLERQAPAWQLDARESTRRALKYRRGPGEVIIVTHEGRGWWDATGRAKGDVFALVQHLDPCLNFGQVRQALRPLVGLAPSFPKAERKPAPANGQAPAQRWASRPRLRPCSQAWRYLVEGRGLPSAVIVAADRQDAVREGHYGSAWFAHRTLEGRVSHVECRGPGYRGALAGGTKVLFRLTGGPGPTQRIAVCEAPIDAMSLAALEGLRVGTLYLATGGSMGPGTADALQALLASLSSVQDALLSGATDANPPGDRYAAHHAEIAAAAGVRFERLRPEEGTDWNDLLVARKGRAGR